MEDNLNDQRSLNLFHTPDESNKLYKDIADADDSELDNYYIPGTEHKSWSENFTDAVVEFGGSKTFIIIIAVILLCWILLNAKLWTMI